MSSAEHIENPDVILIGSGVMSATLGGVLKNIIAIAVGMGDGQGAGDNTRSALITRGLAEVTRLGVAMGGRTTIVPPDSPLPT